MKPLIDILPTLLGQSDSLDKAIEFTLKNPNSPESPARLSGYMKIQVNFHRPVWIKMGRRDTRYKNVHIFSHLFWVHHNLCYARSNASKGYVLDIESIESWKPIPKTSNTLSFETFKKKFDPKFITDSEIIKLWNHKSSQHGNQYNRNDFRQLSKTGQKLMKEFLISFKGINTKPNIGYIDSLHGNYKVLTSHYRSSGKQNSSFGRDITISHQTNCSYVYYSSEYPGCGNGRYGLIANEREYLWLEDD